MPPADTQEIACSVLRPPNTTATRVFGGVGTALLPVAVTRGIRTA